MRYFLFVWGVLAVFINSNDTYSFNLQQMGIESLVERGRIYLEGSKSPYLQPMGDTFRYQGHVYAAKQPGQFFIGSIPYFFLNKLGLTYLKDYLLTGALVTFFTSSFMVALIIMMVFITILQLTHSSGGAIAVSLFTGFGTILFPYSGVTHHDIYGAFFAFLCFFLLFMRYRTKTRSARFLIPFAGFIGSFTLFSSLLPLAVILICGFYVFLFRQKRDIFLFALFFLLGLVPLIGFNWIVFNHPMNFPNVVGHFSDTMPHLSILNILKKFRFYLLSPSNSIFFYSPIVLWALIGFRAFPKKYSIERILIPSCFVLMLCHLSTMQTVGDSQFGPRYLIPLMPLIMLGAGGFYMESWSKAGNTPARYRLVKAAVIITGIFSVIICTVGAMNTVMYHTINTHAILVFIPNILRWDLPQFPLAYLGAAMILLSGALHFFDKDSAKIRNDLP